MDRNDLEQHFKRLQHRMIAGVLLLVILPLAALTIFFHVRFESTITTSKQLELAAFSESLGSVIDLFVEERFVNLFGLYHDRGFNVSPSDEKIKSYLNQLQRINRAFVNVGFFNERGEQLAYAGKGPFQEEMDGTISNWMPPFLNQDKDHFIGDIFKGPSGKPFFAIAAKQTIDNRPYLFKAVVDPQQLFSVLRNVKHVEQVEYGLLDQRGHYWHGSEADSLLPALISSISIDLARPGVHEMKKDGIALLVNHVDLVEAPWALVVMRRLHSKDVSIYRSNRWMTASLLILLFAASAVVVFTVNRFARYAQRVAETKRELQYQLIHASKLASLGELATGIAHEVNNPLAIITATSSVIRDMFDPEFGLDSSPEKILAEIDSIERAAFRARGITRQLLDYGRKYEPKKIPCDLNALLGEVLNGLKEKEFALDNITLRRNFADDLSPILADPDQIRQVFLNLVNNAGDAISGTGKIEVVTGSDGDTIHAIVRDSGKGMAPEQLEQIFNPFFTTKEVGKGTGLGLSISLNIIESMGGAIDVQSEKGVGSSFKVSFPMLAPDEASGSCDTLLCE